MSNHNHNSYSSSCSKRLFSDIENSTSKSMHQESNSACLKAQDTEFEDYKTVWAEIKKLWKEVEDIKVTVDHELKNNSVHATIDGTPEQQQQQQMSIRNTPGAPASAPTSTPPTRTPSRGNVMGRSTTFRSRGVSSQRRKGKRSRTSSDEEADGYDDKHAVKKQKSNSK